MSLIEHLRSIRNPRGHREPEIPAELRPDPYLQQLDPDVLTYGKAADLGIATPGVDFPVAIHPDTPYPTTDHEIFEAEWPQGRFPSSNLQDDDYLPRKGRS